VTIERVGAVEGMDWRKWRREREREKGRGNTCAKRERKQNKKRKQIINKKKESQQNKKREEKTDIKNGLTILLVLITFL